MLRNLLAIITFFTTILAPYLTHASGVSNPAKGVTPKYCPAPPKNSHELRDIYHGDEKGKASFDLDSVTLTINVKSKYQLWHANWVSQIDNKNLKIYHCPTAMGVKITAAEYKLVKWTLIYKIPLSELD